ncbi:MAG: site-specific integrase [Actinomycetota bacterium]|nr:site-specific integrase [Actinomycetota bacterium]
MAHIQKKCKRCRRTVAGGKRVCICGSREATYVARYIDPDRHERSRSFAHKGEADQFVHGEEARKVAGTWIDPALGRETLAAFFHRWHAGAVALGSPAPSTLAKYESVFRLHIDPLLGRRELRSITRDDVRAALSVIRSPWQAEEALKLMRMLFNRAVDAEIVGRNPAARIETPATQRDTVRVLTPSELAAVVAELPERWRALALLGAYGSLRWSELVAIKRDDVDHEARLVRVDEKVVEVGGRFEWGTPKTEGSARVVDLPEAAMRPLLEHLLRFPPLRDQEDPRLEGLVFYGEKAGLVRRHVFREVWRDACAAAGVDPIRLEWLRHTGASLAYRATGDMKAVAERLGHTSTRMMDTVYVKLYPEVSRGVADAIDRLVQASGK